MLDLKHVNSPMGQFIHTPSKRRKNKMLSEVSWRKVVKRFGKRYLDCRAAV